jgi:hypothetical protein
VPQPQPQKTAPGYVIETLTANGYPCAQEELCYLCNVPNSNWQVAVAVAWLVETDKISIWYDSYQSARLRGRAPSSRAR